MNRKKHLVITGALIVALMLILTPLSVMASPGSVTHGVPPGPGEATWKTYPAGMGYLDFEDKSEGYVLGEEIPGVKFITTAGEDWRVGAWSSGSWNGK